MMTAFCNTFMFPKADCDTTPEKMQKKKKKRCKNRETSNS